ncbi:hypothetical protein [Kitasatospora sp. NPDC096140]|uniref:EF-hand domain-containing protein n=1 Tax=Kitasatospora sp. NPDC096140 TaxID=3155425 RepID=UPI0033185E29
MTKETERAEGLFSALDNDKDGSISRADFDRLTLVLGASVGIAPGEEGWRTLDALTGTLWQRLTKITGTAESGKVTKDAMVRAAYHPDLKEYFLTYVLIPYRMMDRDRDRKVSLTEWMVAKTLLGYSQADALERFQNLDEDDDLYIPIAEVKKELEEVWG